MYLDEKFCVTLLKLIDLVETLGRDKFTCALILDQNLNPAWRQEFERLRADAEIQKGVTIQLVEVLELRHQMVELVAALRRGDQPQIPKDRIN